MFNFLLFTIFIKKSKFSISNADIGIIIDDSVSVFEEDFNKEKEFIYRIYQKIEPSKTESKISVAKFSTDASLIIKFSDSESMDINTARKLIDCADQSKGGTCINTALEMASNDMFGSNITREDALKILIIITDGSCNCAGCSEMMSISNGMKEQSIKIITVGVGYGIDEEELRSIATEPKYFFPAKGFDEVLDVIPDIFALFEDIAKEPRISKKKNSKSNPEDSAVSDSLSYKNDTIIINNDEFLKSANSSRNNKNIDCCSGKKDDGSIPFMTPIIVNIQTCPNSKVSHVECTPGLSRCFNIEKNFLLDPDDLQKELCQCSDLALRNNLNYFKIDKKGTCSIGTSNAENCKKRRSIQKKLKCQKSASILYITESK